MTERLASYNADHRKPRLDPDSAAASMAMQTPSPEQREERETISNIMAEGMVAAADHAALVAERDELAARLAVALDERDKAIRERDEERRNSALELAQERGKRIDMTEQRDRYAEMMRQVIRLAADMTMAVDAGAK